MRELTLEGWIIGYLLNEGPATSATIATAHDDPLVTEAVVEKLLWRLWGMVYQINDQWHVS